MTVRLWLRADASASMGFGHVMRLLAVAERAGNVGIEPRFVVGGGPVARNLIATRGFRAIGVDFGSRSWLGDVSSDDFVVFDGYHFGLDLLWEAGDRAARVGAVEDFGGGEFPVDVLLNQNPVTAPHYELNKGGVALVGPRYALVRQEFLAHRRHRGGDPPRTLLVTMGGSDVAGLTTAAIARAPGRAAFDRMLVVVGPAADVDSAQTGPDVEVVRAPADVARTFASADAAISAAGSTTWELLTMGLPTALVEVAPNQQHIGPGVARAKAGIFLGGPDDFDGAFVDATQRLAEPAERRQLSDRALSLVDGRGAQRFLDALQGRPVRADPPP